MTRSSITLIISSGLLLAAAALAPIPHEADLKEEIAFFKLHDTNDDGFHTKKEFYYAVMEDAFEPLVNKYNKFAVDMEFEMADTDGDKKVSLEEWTKLFFHEEPQSASYVDGAPRDTADEDPAAPLQEPADLPPPEVPDVEPITAESPQPAAGFAGVAVKSEVEKKMVLVTEITLNGPHKASGNKAYTATEATWIEAHDFCQEAGARLCSEQELCPMDAGTPTGQKRGVSLDKAILKEVDASSKHDLHSFWIPIQTRQHLWVEQYNCGLTRWPDDHSHEAIVVCCEDPASEAPAPAPAPAPPTTAAQDPPANEGSTAVADGGEDVVGAVPDPAVAAAEGTVQAVDQDAGAPTNAAGEGEGKMMPATSQDESIGSNTAVGDAEPVAEGAAQTLTDEARSQDSTQGRSTHTGPGTTETKMDALFEEGRVKGAAADKGKPEAKAKQRNGQAAGSKSGTTGKKAASGKRAAGKTKKIKPPKL